MSQILFIRHGPTAWNTDGRIQGRTDVPLSQDGRAQVAAWRVPPPFQSFRWVSSPLGRALETVKLLGIERFETDDRLQEADWGDWEGRSLRDLRVELGDALAKNERRGLDLAVPNGESPRMVRDRLSTWLQEVAPARQPLVAVCHNGILRAAYSLAAGWDMRDDAPLVRRHSMAHLYHLAADGGLRIKRLNIDLHVEARNANLPGDGYDD